MTTLTRLTTAPRNTKMALAGLAIGILGLLIQWIADPPKFGIFPPGILVIAVCGALVAFGARWWWTPIFATAIGIWIVIGGFLSGQLTENLASGDLGTIIGNIVMCLGLLLAAVTGVLAMIEGRRRSSSQ
ncbi:hypothetical protein [Nocardia altamirensis]|uniref:hypothetical protein n=1 Tax=Nocardia altamirensis TaxID=472158 RepID=UPI0008405D80|nr:hypothetical protein [Nocardia altamirensis]